MKSDYQNNSITFDADDKLHRKPYAKSIISIINNFQSDLSENASLVLALDSPWGTGKSVFCRMLKNEIAADESTEIKTIIYNAWENDYCENAFHALFATFLQDDNVFDKEFTHADAELVRGSLIKVLKGVSKDAASIVHLEGFLDAATTFKSSYRNFLLSCEGPLKSHNEQQKAFYAFKDLLIRNSSWFDNPNHKLLIIVDELDRCRPSFSIETLEIIKHIFNIPNVVFLLSIDFSQLKHSIATIYGQGMDSEGYLRRFVNYVLKLPEPQKPDYIDYLYSELPLPSKDPEFFEDVKQVLLFSPLSIRDINVIYENFRIFFISKFSDNPHDKNALPYLVLMVFKYKKPDDFNKIVNGESDDAVMIKVNRTNIDVKPEYKIIDALENHSIMACLKNTNPVDSYINTKNISMCKQSSKMQSFSPQSAEFVSCSVKLFGVA